MQNSPLLWHTGFSRWEEGEGEGEGGKERGNGGDGRDSGERRQGRQKREGKRHRIWSKVSVEYLFTPFTLSLCVYLTIQMVVPQSLSRFCPSPLNNECCT